MFKQRYVPSSELASTPTPRYPSQALDFQPDALPAPSWCTGLRAGNLPGGGFPNPNVFAHWWRDLVERDEKFVVQIVCDDLIVGAKVRRSPTRLIARVKPDSGLNPSEARRMAAALIEAADLIEA